MTLESPIAPGHPPQGDMEPHITLVHPVLIASMCCAMGPSLLLPF